MNKTANYDIFQLFRDFSRNEDTQESVKFKLKSLRFTTDHLFLHFFKITAFH